MANGPTTAVLQLLRRIGARRARPAPDAQLLARFAADRDEAAFTALVERHGPMILGVCRRILHDPNDAEDAFQATFLVLVKKAGSISRPQLLANWLYGVARRTALRARAEAAKRRARERQVAQMPAADAADEVLWRDLRPVLDDEISRLPARYRAPFVLCCLEGRTNQEAAESLACPKGTVLSRLSRAKERLRKRLTKRGVTLTAVACATLLTEQALSAAVPDALTQATAKAGLAYGAGGLVSTQVLSLAEGVLRAMYWTRLTLIAALVAAAGLTAGFGAVGYAALEPRPASQEKQDEKPAEPKKAEAPKGDEGAARMNRLLQARYDAAVQALKCREEEFIVGKGDQLRLYADSIHVLKAQREMGRTKAERLAAYEAHLKRMRHIEEVDKERFEAGRLNLAEYAEAQFYRLDAEIDLERAKQAEQ